MNTYLFIFFSFITLVLQTSNISTCLMKNKISGQCTDCAPDRILVENKCFLYIVGCFKYQNQQQCLSCKNGFALVDRLCIDQKKKNETKLKHRLNLENDHLASLPLQSSSLNSKQKIELLKLHNVIKQTYKTSKELLLLKINDVKVIQSIKGNIYSFIYGQKRENRYEAQGQVTIYGVAILFSLQKIHAIIFDLRYSVHSIIGYNRINNLQLTNSKIYLVEKKQNQVIKLNYVNKYGQLFTYEYKKSNFTEIQNLTFIRQPIQKKQVMRFIYCQMKTTQLEKNYTFQTYTHNRKRRYKVNFASGLTVTIEQRYLKLYLISSQDQPLTKSEVPIYGNGMIVNGKNIFTDFNDSTYKKSKTFLELKYPELTKMQQKVVYYQMIKGVIFEFHYQFTTSKIIAETSYSLEGLINITNITKDGKSILNQYNYHNDPLFAQVINLIRQELSVFSSINVLKVQRLLISTTTIDFNVSFSQIFYCIVRYRMNAVAEERFELLTYKTDLNEAQQIIQQEKLLKKQILLINFLKIQKPQIIRNKNYFICNLSENKTISNLTLITPKGIFQIYIQNRWLPILKKVTLISKQNYCQMGLTFAQNHAKIKKMKALLESQYSQDLQDHKLDVIQVKVVNYQNNKIHYKFLYCNETYHTIVQILFQQIGQYNFEIKKFTKPISRILLPNEPEYIAKQTQIQAMFSFYIKNFSILYSQISNQKIQFYFQCSLAYLSTNYNIIHIIFGSQVSIEFIFSKQLINSSFSCLINEIKYKDHCFLKINNCKLQIGSICVQCKLTHILKKDKKICFSDFHN